MIILTVTFCMTLNPMLCRTLEMVPDDGRKITSQMECIKGGAIGGMSFELDHIEWRTKGWRCIEKPSIISAWRDQRDRVD